MAPAAASSVELAGCKAAESDVDDTSGVLIDSADERRKSCASEGEPQGEDDKWTSVFSSGREDPHWARLKGGIIHPQSRK